MLLCYKIRKLKQLWEFSIEELLSFSFRDESYCDILQFLHCCLKQILQLSHTDCVRHLRRACSECQLILGSVTVTPANAPRDRFGARVPGYRVRYKSDVCAAHYCSVYWRHLSFRRRLRGWRHFNWGLGDAPFVCGLVRKRPSIAISSSVITTSFILSNAKGKKREYDRT